MVLFTDASKDGWGAVAVHQGVPTVWADHWPEGYAEQVSINLLETEAVLEAVTRIGSILEPGHPLTEVRIYIDNTSAMKWVLKGAAATKLANDLVSNINETAKSENLVLSLTYIKSAENPADGPSRNRPMQMTDFLACLLRQSALHKAQDGTTRSGGDAMLGHPS